MSYYMSGLFNINTSSVCLYGQDKCYPQCSFDCGYMRVQLKGNGIYFGNWIWGKESECSWMNRRWLQAQEGHTVILFCSGDGWRRMFDACMSMSTAQNPDWCWQGLSGFLAGILYQMSWCWNGCGALLSLAPPVNPTHSPTNITAFTRSCSVD